VAKALIAVDAKKTPNLACGVIMINCQHPSSWALLATDGASTLLPAQHAVVFVWSDAVL